MFIQFRFRKRFAPAIQNQKHNDRIYFFVFGNISLKTIYKKIMPMIKAIKDPGVSWLSPYIKSGDF
jgi:hypothetical protein